MTTVFCQIAQYTIPPLVSFFIRENRKRSIPILFSTNLHTPFCTSVPNVRNFLRAQSRNASYIIVHKQRISHSSKLLFTSPSLLIGKPGLKDLTIRLISHESSSSTIWPSFLQSLKPMKTTSVAKLMLQFSFAWMPLGHFDFLHSLVDAYHVRRAFSEIF